MYLYTIYRSYLTAKGAEKYCQLEAFPQTISSEKGYELSEMPLDPIDNTHHSEMQ